MSAEAQVQKLESLLARVQHNAALPRAKRPLAPATPIEVAAPAPSFAEDSVTRQIPVVEAAATRVEIELTPAAALEPAAPAALEVEAVELTPEPLAAKPISGEFAVAAEAPALELVEISAAEERPEDEEIVDLDDLAVDEDELVAAEEVDSRRAVAAELADEAPSLEVHETPTDVVSLEVHEDEEEHGPPESGRALVAAPHESARVAVAAPTAPEPEALQAIELEEVRAPSVHPEVAPAIEAREAAARAPSVHPEAAPAVELEASFAPAVELEASFAPAIESGEARGAEAPHAPSVRPEPTPAIEAHEEFAAAERAPSVRPEPTPAIELEPVRAPSVHPEPVLAPEPSVEALVAAPVEEIPHAPSVHPESAPPTARPEAEALVELVAASAVEAPEPIAAAPVVEPIAAVEVVAAPAEPERIVTAVVLSAPAAHARPVEGVTVRIEAAVLRPEVTPAEIVAFVGAVRDLRPDMFGALLDAALEL